jgi:putative PEP-CTERM system histidine kinase
VFLPVFLFLQRAVSGNIRGMTAVPVIELLGACCGAFLALSVFWRRQRSLAHWAFAGGMLALAAESLFFGLAADAVLLDTFAHWEGLALIAMAFLPGFWLLFSLAYARGNSREFLSRWRIALGIAFAAPVALAFFFSGDLISAVGRPPDSGHLMIRLGFAGSALNLLFLLSSVLVLMNLERTFRAAVGTMRWRIKFIVLGLGVLFGVRAYTCSQALLFHGGDVSLQVVNSGALLVACLLMLRGLLRTGNFDANIYPSHSLLHRSFTVLLAGVYLLIVGVFAKVVTFLGGDSAFPIKAFLVLLSLVLLAVLLLSDRVRLHTRRFVSRHLQRPVYDYRSVWNTFTEGTARRVEPIELCATVVKLVSEVFQALSVTIWIADERKEKLVFGASTTLSPAKAGQLSIEASDAADIITALSNHPDPVDLDSSKEFWAAALRRAHPHEFPEKGGNRICVPMRAGGELLGVLTLGDRVGGVPFSVQDFDLVKTVANQAAASLLNIQLSQRLSQAKQLEAFQAMSAFFVHDLKNTASTLSLMLHNLPVHYQDPQFREDALRGVSKTVDHINDLIGRLTALRHELVIHAVECDLNELVADTLHGQEEAPGVTFIKDLHPLPRIRLDPAQIQKVIVNLVLNARDAVPSGGQIRVETGRRNGWAVLAIVDNGCGMTPDFVQNSLFRPFQTTKKKGIGIGMFHCKMIVEAHRGRIEVESRPGNGTAFRVLLPLIA